MWSREFWKSVAERGLKTFVQAAVAVLIAAGTDLIGTDWIGLLSIAGMAALISLLTSIGSGGITGGNTSLTDSEQVVEK